MYSIQGLALSNYFKKEAKKSKTITRIKIFYNIILKILATLFPIFSKLQYVNMNKQQQKKIIYAYLQTKLT